MTTGQATGIVISHWRLHSALLWSRLMGKYFAGTPYAQYFPSNDAANNSTTR